MSNRDSMGFGELIPQDVVDIFAQEKHVKRGRKKRSNSLGRALGWLKGKKRKDVDAKGQSLGLGPALDLALDGRPAGPQGGHKGGQRAGRQAHPQAAPKRDDDDKTAAPPLFQENVFIEASRPKYVENLHIEALEGLKMMQQEETNNGVEYQDNESTISSATVHTDGEGGGFVTDSTIADTTSVISVQSSVSTRSSRSGLTRQGSTFRPLNSGKKSEKTRTRRRHRKTVGGIPDHVQRELGLDRVGWTVTQKLDEEHLYNGESDTSPTTDGPQRRAGSYTGASGGLGDINANQPLNKEQLEQLSSAPHAGHRDDLALLHCLGPASSDEQRPQSLAVPWMTTANSLQQEPPSPVMTMSPQAAYMSKIIPNAVLPPSIDVVEISRGRSRNSVRTVSKSSLLLSSPAPSRASSRASTITSASRNNPPNMSDSSCWSNSESSETLVSESSTISSNSAHKQKKLQNGNGSSKEDRISVHSSNSKASKYTSNGKLIVKGDQIKKEGPFVRSLSVMKPKRAPPPPNRSYSLHNKMKRRSRDLAEARVTSGESSLHGNSATVEENQKNPSGSSPIPSSVVDSPGYNADTSSLDDSTGSASFSPMRSQLKALKAEEAATVSKDASQEKQESLQDSKQSKVVSPSSGYSSLDGTSAHLSKPPLSSSPKHKRGILAKLQRLFPSSTSAASTPPSLTQPKAPENTKSTEGLKPTTSVDTVSVSPSVRALRELFNIPPPPKVHAPPPPPPEVWAHSKRSFELLLGPPAPEDLQAIIKKNPKDRRQQRKSPSASTEGSVKSLVVEKTHKNLTITAESINGALHMLGNKKGQESEIMNAENHIEKNDRLDEQNVDLKGNRKVTEKDEKVRASDILSGMLVKAVERREERLATMRGEEEAKNTSTHSAGSKNKTDTFPTISLLRMTPSPPPAHNPPDPRGKQTTAVTSVSTVQVAVSPEMSWPPPPPPVGLGGTDEIDFPLPPPPMFGEDGFVVPVQVPPERPNPTKSILPVVNADCVSVTTEAEPQKPRTSKGIVSPPLNIPPPPSYTAPPPPVQAVSPPLMKNVSPQVPKKVFLPPIKEVSPLPPTEVPSPSVKEVSPPPPSEVPPPSIEEVSLPPSKEVSPPPLSEVPPPSVKEASSLPPPSEVPPPSVKEASPPPPPTEVIPPSIKEVSLPPSKEVSPPPPTEVLSPPTEVSLPPTEVSPPEPKQVSPERPEELSPPLVQEAPPSLVKDISSTVSEVAPPSVEEVSPPLVIQVSPLPPQEVTTLSTEEVVPPSSSQDNAQQYSEEATPVSRLAPPESIPPPPPQLSLCQSSDQETDLPQETVPSESETNLVSSSSILNPPQSIPPPPPIELIQQPQVLPSDKDGPATQGASHSPPSEASAPPASDEGLVSVKQQPSPTSTENQTVELTSAPAVQEESTPIATPSLLQMVKLRSVGNSPEPPKAQEQQAEAEVTMRNHDPNSSASGEAPPKPIRRSLIMTSPIPTSPPAEVTSPPALPNSQPLTIPPTSSSTVTSPTKKSPPAMAASPSMNLQEAIRLRTAARSNGGPAARISLHSPKSPIDLHKSPTSTASFIFSKSNKRVVIETKPATETKANIQSSLQASSVTKVVSEAESVKKEVKVPPPVAKKPKSKGKESETSEGTEQTAGQEALPGSVKDAEEKTHGTANAVEG